MVDVSWSNVAVTLTGDDEDDHVISSLDGGG